MNRRSIVLGALVAIVVGNGQSPAQPSPPRATLTEVLRLDATREDFPSVSRAWVGPRGQVVVPISQDGHVRIYDSTGKRVATVGRTGSGPGEFRSLSIAGWIADTLWITDVQQRRTVFVDPANKVLRTVGYPTPKLAGAARPAAPPAASARGEAPRNQPVIRYYPTTVHPDGSMTGTAFVWPGTMDRETAASMRRQLIRVAPDSTMRVIATPPPIEDARWYMEIAGFGNSIPFMYIPQLVFSRDGERFAHMSSVVRSSAGGTFTVSHFRANGDTAFVRTFAFRGVPIPQRAKDSAAAEFIPKPGDPTEGPSDLGRRFQAMALQKMPPVYAGVEAIHLGLDRTTWIRLRRTADGHPFLVLDERGEPVRTVEIPARSRLFQASLRKIWVGETDADGLTSIVVYNVR